MVKLKNFIRIYKSNKFVSGSFIKRTSAAKLFIFKIKKHFLKINMFKNKIKFLLNSSFFLNKILLNDILLNIFEKKLFFLTLTYFNKFFSFKNLNYIFNIDILNTLNFFKIKIFFFLLNFKFNLKKTNYMYITNNFTKLNYLFITKSLSLNIFSNYFTFLTKLKKLFSTKKSYFIDTFISKKKSGIFKKRNNVKNFLFFKTKKLLLFNSKNKFNNKYFNILKKKESKTSFNNLFIKFIKKQKLNFTNNLPNLKSLPLKKGFFKVLLENRNLIKTVYFFKSKKNNFLNKFISKKIFIPTKDFYLKHEFSLLNILIRSQFFYFKSDILVAFRYTAVYINGIPVFNLNKFLNIGDRIQLVITDNYYYYFRTYKFITLNFLKKIKKKMLRMFKPKNDMYKQKSNYIPDWIFKMIYYYNDIPLYIEVDFIIMTAVIISKPFRFYEYNFINWVFLSAYIYRLYNWKKII